MPPPRGASHRRHWPPWRVSTQPMRMAADAALSLGLAVIARDEEHTLPGLLGSIAGCFDQVVLLDTGSVDRTVEIFERWAADERARNPAFRGDLGRWHWRDDFAAARHAANTMLRTDWQAWADADDEIRGASHLRRLIAAAPADIAAFVAGYEYSHNPEGQVVELLERIRVLRCGVGQWRDPVHEELVVHGKLGGIAHGTTMWVHRKSTKPEPPDPARNMRLLLAWLEREPDNPRALHYAGREEAAHGSDADAVCYFRRFFAHYPVWDELSAQVHRHLALSLIRLGRVEEAAEDARAVVAAMPGWPDSYLTLAECALEVGDAAGAIEN